ncbi:hypothetical protein BCR33DRAFT_724163 [Rhizoclosmatium globosum]|uniref:Uncharacterized protein n=1 Tax=Rhizoclosmatium globosum TaxID=329046 RepID=A0A1Y2B7X7_9FUNG|nr:hypothetical protein BCR33DRAFT_724163 [Rhizoclosmatium globosum]|eukprot:ORY30941.1 hypothetical protein BCR33DRAFT_724163 [Rhizoclosmatium globosum]
MEQQPTASTVLVWYLLIDRHGEAIAESSIDGVLVSDGATVLEFRRRVLATNAAILGCDNVVASHLSVFKSARDFVRGEAVALTANVTGLQSCVEKPLLVAVRANLTKRSLQFDQTSTTTDIHHYLNGLSPKNCVSDAAVPALEPTVEHERNQCETISESPNDVLLSACKLLLTALNLTDSYIANQDDVQRKIQDKTKANGALGTKDQKFCEKEYFEATYPRVYEATPAYIDQNGFLHQPGFLPSSDQSDQPVYLPLVGPIPNEPPAEWVIPVSKPITIRNPDDQNVLKPVKIQNPKTSAIVTISANGDIVESVDRALNPDASDFVVEHDNVEPEVEQLIPSVVDSVDSVVSIEAPDSCESITCNSDFKRLDDNDSNPTSPTGMPIPSSVFNPNIYKSQPWWSIETSSDEEDTSSQVIPKIN